jgi:hypothetical protein
LSGLGTQYKYFQTLTIDSGAAWTVGGAATYIAANMTIEGFNNHDRLDLTDLSFNAGDTATVNGGNQLIIDDPSGNITIQMDSSVSGDLFTLVQDSNGDTFIEESDYTPCYCRSIHTPKGEVAVKALKMGNHVTTADGTVPPIKWIGQRSYRDCRRWGMKMRSRSASTPTLSPTMSRHATSMCRPSMRCSRMGC